MTLKPFPEPIYITRPILADISEVQNSIAKIWAAKILTNGGPQHKEFEREINAKLKVSHTSLFNNGTIALATACQALNITGEVITTPLTFAATPHVLTLNGIKPVFCDVDSETMNLDPQKIENLINSKTSAILGVHLYGTPCDVNLIQKIAHRYNLKVIYDAAHAFGTEIDGIGIGNFGDISMFSFHATKLFHTFEGGCLTCNNLDLKTRIDLLKNFGIKNEEEIVFPGSNGKMNELQAAIGLINLKLIAQEKQKRENLARIYIDELKEIPGIKFLPYSKNINPSMVYFVIRINAKEFGFSRDQVQNKLKEFNVFTRKYGYPLCSDYPCYKDFPESAPSKLANATQVSQEVLALPFYGELEEEQVKNICQMIKSIRS